MRITFLEADRPLTKSFTLEKGVLRKESYPHVTNFTSIEGTISSIEDLHESLSSLAAERNICVLKGNVTRPLVAESRAGSTDPAEPTQIMVVDVDKLDGVLRHEDVISLLGPAFRNTSYIVQYSASYGIDPDAKFSAHIFFILSEPVLPDVLKAYLKHINLSIPQLQSNLRLAKSKIVLKWVLDISVAQNDKLIYIASPLYSKKIKPTITDEERIILVEHKHDTLDLSAEFAKLNPAADQATMLKVINKLRKDEGLGPKRKEVMREVKDGTQIHMVQSGADQAIITGQRKERGFVYFNLNGGNSWGYYHPEGKPDVIFNFKGEPNYLTKELLPDYYKEAARHMVSKNVVHGTNHTAADSEEEVRYIGVLDKRTGRYFRGAWWPQSNDAEVYEAQTLKIFNDFFLSRGETPPEIIDEWDLEFRYDITDVVVPEDKFINLYRPSDYMVNANTEEPGELPPECRKVIFNALGSCEETLEHFLNWLAAIVQTHQKMGTAWILSGTQGTGKGVMFHNIITPMIGRAHAEQTHIGAIKGTFNGYLEKAIFILVDEVEAGDMKHFKGESQVTTRLKSMIANERMDIRKMRTESFTVNNYSNFIFAGNGHAMFEIPRNDRRFNVAPRQEKMLRPGDIDFKLLASEIQGFTNYLVTRDVDLQKAKTPMQSSERARMQELSMSTADIFCESIVNGELEDIWADRPMTSDMSDLIASNKGHTELPSFIEAFGELYENKEHGKVRADALQTLIYYHTGHAFDNPGQRTKFFGNRGIHLKKIRINNKTASGFSNKTGKWNFEPFKKEFLEEYKVFQSRQLGRHIKRVK